jgi:hypothetical protein
LIGKPEGKRPLGRTRRRWEYNIQKYIKEVGYNGVCWINLAHDKKKWQALCEQGDEPWGSKKCAGNFLTSCGSISFSRRNLLREVGLE